MIGGIPTGLGSSWGVVHFQQLLCISVLLFFGDILSSPLMTALSMHHAAVCPLSMHSSALALCFIQPEMTIKSQQMQTFSP